jgi:hypothetical protein
MSYRLHSGVFKKNMGNKIINSADVKSELKTATKETYGFYSRIPKFLSRIPKFLNSHYKHGPGTSFPFRLPSAHTECQDDSRVDAH